MRAGSTTVAAVLVAAAMITAVAVPARSQSQNGVEQRLRTLEDRLDAIERQLANLNPSVDKMVLVEEARITAVEPVDVTVPAGVATRGEATAGVAIIEFTDFQCPFCRRFEQETFRHIERNHIKTGQLIYVSRHFPLEAIHSSAFKAAESVACAGDQGRAWELREALLAGPQALALASLIRRAELLGLDVGRFRACLQGQHSGAVRRDIGEGARLGVTSTPTFFVGRVLDDGRIRVHLKVVGAQHYATFKEAIGMLAAEAAKH